MSQFHPQSAGLGLNKKLGGMYGGMWNFIPSTCWPNPIALCPESLLTVKKKKSTYIHTYIKKSISTLPLSDRNGWLALRRPCYGNGCRESEPQIWWVPAVIMNNPLAVIKISHKSNCIYSLKRQKVLSPLLCSNSGIGGLQFGVQPHTAGMNGAANYGMMTICC